MLAAHIADGLLARLPLERATVTVHKPEAPLGLEFDADKGMWVHNLRTAVMGPDGKLVRAMRGSDWKPDDLVAALRDAVSAR